MSPEDNNQQNIASQPPDNNIWLSLEFDVRSNHPELLNGLDSWLELGLVDPMQVMKFCRQNLSCPLPEIKVARKIQTEELVKNIAESKELVIASQPSFINRVWQGFLDELSIRWLLFLGIFLVVVSSGVLAASQWNNFPRFAQYLILLVYTLGFWGIGFWSARQDNLKLTSQTLSAIAILLVPINCWAIGHFGLGNSIWEWITLVVALAALGIILVCQPQLSKKYNNKFFLPLFIVLSLLQLVWHLILNPIFVIYGSIFIIAAIHYLFLLPKQQYPFFSLLFLLSAWSLLLVRTLLSPESFLTDSSLAIATFGWILATIYLTKEKQALVNTESSQSETEKLTDAFISKVLQVISILLFIATWFVSVLAGVFSDSLFFWQTVAINCLAIHLYSQRLTLYWRKRDITAIFFIGLQTLYISKELIPTNIRSGALDLAVNISKTEYLPESVFGVTLFPYVILFIFIASWLYRQEKTELANYTEGLTFLLGIGLTYLSLSNPTWRSLNLLFSTATLGYVAYIRQPLRIFSIYLTHLLGLITIINGIDVMFPNLSESIWGGIFILLMAGEWLIYSRQRRREKQNLLSVFKETSWYAGLLLAGLSYLCFSVNIIDRYPPKLFTVASSLIWLAAPGMLTWVAKYTPKIRRRRAATSLSCIALIMAQFLVLTDPLVRLIALGFAIALMFVNAFYLRRTWVTALHWGFALSLLVSLADSFIRDENWLIVGGLLILGLYKFYFYLKDIIDTPRFDYISQRNGYGTLGVGVEAKNYKLIRKYIKSNNYWAIALTTITTVSLSFIYLDLAKFNIYPQYLITAVLILGGIIWRYRQQPDNYALYTSIWLMELIAVGIVSLLGGKDFSFAVINILLGLAAWLLFQSTNNSPWAKLNLNYIPLVYAALAILWRSHLYNSYTGIITLGAAFLLINTPQKNKQLNLITNYLGCLGITCGIYELVIYKMQQSSGGSAADGMTILALVAAAIAFSYRLTAWWCRQHNYQTIFNLKLTRVILVAHIHWAISSILKIVAASIAIESTTPRLTPLSIASSFCLGGYAVIQGKDCDRANENNNNNNDWWVYVGLVEIVATLVYSRLIISKLSFFDPWRVIFTCAIALLIYQIPWQNFGWRETPWQRMAVVTPALMTLVTAEDISYFSLLVTTIFYLRIAYSQKNPRWSYLSLGFINWAILRLVWQFNTEVIWLAAITSLSLLYIAQIDPYFVTHRQQRHFLRSIACTIICVAALFYQDPGIIPGGISFALILLGLGLRIRALLFSGTITLILTVFYQLATLIAAYSFLKWVVGLLAGIFSIVIAAGFEKNRDRFTTNFKNYYQQLQDWQ